MHLSHQTPFYMPSMSSSPLLRRKMRLSVNTPSLPGRVKAKGAEVEDGEPLSPVARLFRQPQFNCHIVTILGFRKIFDAKELKAGLETLLLSHPRFSSIQVTDKSWGKKLRWVRTKVNLNEHIVFPDLGPVATAAASNPVVGDCYVENYAANLSRSPFDLSRPLWDLHILAIRTSEAACVAIFRIHHSLGDGISIMSLFLASTRSTSDPKSLPSLPEVRHRPIAVASRSGLLMFLCWIWTFLIYSWNTLINTILFFSSAFFLKDTITPIMGNKGVEYQPKLFVHRTLCLDEIKAIKSTIGCTINDVLVGVTSAALSRYLCRSYGGVLPKHLRIRTTQLVNIRPIPGIHSFADMMKERSEMKWGNRIGYILLRLPVIKCEDPLDYIRKGAAVTENKKKSWTAIFNHASFLLVDKCLGIKVATILNHRISSNTTLTFSSIIGPIEEVDFCGSPLVYIAPSVYGHPQALTIHFQSYWNKITVVLAVDKRVIPDPHKLLDDIANSLQAMKDAAASRT